MLGLNLVSIAKAELLKYKDHAGHPVAEDAIEDLEAALKVISTFVSELTPADVEAVLHLLPPQVLSKFGEGAITELSNAIVSLPKAIAKVETELEKLDSELKS